MAITKADCVKALTDQGIDKGDANEIITELLYEKKRIQAEGKVGNLQSELSARWMDKAAQAKQAAAMQKRHTAINVIKRQNIDSYIDTVRSEGFTALDALEAMMVGSNKTFSGSRESAMSRRWGILHSWLGPMTNELENVPSALNLMRDDIDFSYSVMREMIEPKSTGDDVARQTADIMSNYLELARQRQNSAGANIGKLEGYAPQNHDPVRLLSKSNGSVDGWVNFMVDKIDVGRTFPDLVDNPEGVKNALRETFKTITTGRRGVQSPVPTGGGSPLNIAKSVSNKSRVLHFKNADAAVLYHKTYGRGNILANIVNQLEYSARTTSLIETFGPNPEVMIKSIVDAERIKVRADETITPEERVKRERKLSGAWKEGTVTTGDLSRWYAELNGETFSSVNQGVARISSFVRGLNSLSKLGGATLSAIADLFVKANALRHRGNNIFDSYRGAFSQFMTEGRTPEETKQLGRQLGAFLEGSLGDIQSRFNAQDQFNGKMASAMNTFFKYSGLTGWTEAHKAGYIYAFAKDLGENSGLSFKDLNKDLQVVLKRQGVTPKKWEVLRKMVTNLPEGRGKSLVPESAYFLKDNDVLSLLSKSLQSDTPPKGRTLEQHNKIRKEAIERKKADLETELMGLYADECKYAIIEPDDKTRAAMVWGTRPGTFMGETMRFLTQFKSFPIAYYQRILSEGKWKRAGDTSMAQNMMGLSHFAASSVLFGYIAMTAKDLSKGKEPRDPRKLETWFAAGMQSGGAGIFGDFLFGQVSRTGNSLAENLAGPTVSTAGKGFLVAQQMIRGDVPDAGADALRFVLNNTPGINLWYTRAAMDYMFLFHIREMLSPGTLRRTERKMKKEYNQEFLLPPSQVIKRGGGFK